MLKNARKHSRVSTMKKIILRLFLFIFSLSLASCCCTKQYHLTIFKDAQLSSSNQPIFRFALLPFKGWDQYTLVTEDSAGTRQSWGGVATDDFGNVVTENTGLWLPFTLACRDYGPGEYINVWLMKKNQYLMAHVVPFPIKIEQYGYTVRLEKEDRLAYNWHVIGQGYMPGEEVLIVTYSGPRIFTSYMLADEFGEISGLIEAWEEGKYSGETKLEFHGSRGTLYLKFPWGDKWFDWRKKFVTEQQKQDQQFRHDLIWTADYRPRS